MSSVPAPTPAPATPAGPGPRRARDPRIRPVGHARPVRLVLVVLATLLGALFPSGLSSGPVQAAAAAAAQTAPASPATPVAPAAPTTPAAPDPTGETLDPAPAEAGLPGRTRRHQVRVRPETPRPARSEHRRGRTAGRAPAPVPVPRGVVARREVMRC